MRDILRGGGPGSAGSKEGLAVARLRRTQAHSPCSHLPGHAGDGNRGRPFRHPLLKTFQGPVFQIGPLFLRRTATLAGTLDHDASRLSYAGREPARGPISCCATARMAARSGLLPLEHSSNFRDIGGYPAAGGKHVRWGMIFRSGATPLLTDADQAAVAKLHLANMVDLRSDEERQLAPSKIYGVPSPNRRTDPQQRMQHFLKYFSRPLI